MDIEMQSGDCLYKSYRGEKNVTSKNVESNEAPTGL